MNFFNTTLSQIDIFDRNHLGQILDSIKEGAALAN